LISKEVIGQFSSNIRFKEICMGLLSRYYNWDTEQIIEFKDIIKYNEMMFMKNINVKWSLDLIESLKDRIDWGSFYNVNGIDLDLPFFKKYKNNIVFKSIYLNKNIDWSNQLLDTYQDYWNWDDLMMCPIVAQVRNIKKYEDKYDWDKFSSNGWMKSLLYKMPFLKIGINCLLMKNLIGTLTS
tara:strand:- start:182 stop:730 length:549 start_codon:yes stop_codon:yes gene_type:complete